MTSTCTGPGLARTTQTKRETPRLEDYLEAIYHLIQDKGYASTLDISDRLQVRPPTVSNMLRRLAERDYLTYEPYRGMKLTPKGEKVAGSVIARHKTISEFLSIIGVEEAIAYQDSEGIEHYIQPMTVRKIELLVDFLRNNPKVLRAIKDHIAK